MNNRNQEALAMAYKNARAKKAKLVELAIEKEMDQDSKEALMVYLAKAKAETTGKTWQEHIKGQDWYLEHLIAFANMTGQERLDYEYNEVFGEVATEAELVTDLDD